MKRKCDRCDNEATVHEVTIKSGLARAKVPEPAKGFAVKTESGDIVDLGTEFAIKVGKGGSDVRVLDGEVELRPRGKNPRGQESNVDE